MDYEKDITISPDNLDIEWLEQPSLMIKYAQHAAQMRKEVDEAKQNLDVVRAGVDKDIRSNPEKYELGKITEAVVQNAILSIPEYLEANQQLIDAKYEADMARAAVQAMEQRKDALENLVRLFGQQYFAGPKMPRNLTEEWQARQKQMDEGIASKMNRRKR